MKKLTHSWEFSKVLTLRDIYYCSVAPGEIGQIWIDLQYHEFKSIKYRILENFQNLLYTTTEKNQIIIKLYLARTERRNFTEEEVKIW